MKTTLGAIGNIFPSSSRKALLTLLPLGTLALAGCDPGADGEPPAAGQPSMSLPTTAPPVAPTTNPSAAPTTNPSAAPTTPPPAASNALSGTWMGRLSGVSETLNVQFTFSQAGNLLFSYRVKGGEVRTVEWTMTGQQIQYLPPDGGVQTTVVEAVERGTGRFSLILRSTFEESGTSFLTQIFQSEVLEFVLAPEGLRTRYAIVTSSFFNGSPAVDSGQEKSYQGALQK
jgi:hypothetical protein